MSLPVLIVGAGPTGLNLALRLRRHGTPFRLVDQHDGPAEESRALAVHARTLEFYRQLGLADRIVAAGVQIRRVHFREDGEEVATVALGDMGAGLSPYPFVLDYPQDEHERFLVAELARLGVAPDWRTRLDSFEDRGGSVVAQLSGPNGTERLECAYVCGCDGARSRVRDVLQVGFDGGVYPHLYFVADLRLRDEPSRDAHIVIGPDVFTLRMPSRGGDMQRVIGFYPDQPVDAAEPSFDVVRTQVEAQLGVKVAAVNWFSTYRVHHRVASHFRKGRGFLLGDAGHLHSPTGGQGMNTGIGDAVNLSWKLAAVLAGRADAALLDSYEPERIAFARRLVATTDRVFGVIVGGGVRGTVLRHLILPHLLPAATSLAAGRRLIFRTLSQIQISYRDGPIASGAAGAVKGGDRLPWVASLDNYAPLASLDWQVHVYGDVREDFATAMRALDLPVHGFAWSAECAGAGLARDAAYVVRPDGHVGLALRSQDAEAISAYFDRIGWATPARVAA